MIVLVTMLPPSLSGAAHCRVTDLEVVSLTAKFCGSDGGATKQLLHVK